ncbi:two-component system signal transduction histidine kinase [Gottschalkia purinilytica]|uniref:histidine kinase n=1 Tax=Gottschalkia purinilytica TaxID=1503 RepID=A0A0L0W9H5_GOTPU|nr:HAMP domain-containing sensor histidine kinase [Gottschalkia purinilytica]KNF08199.1 two-component system signal transduction histidine kinase [Gottschalkia purinilytica]
MGFKYKAKGKIINRFIGALILCALSVIIINFIIVGFVLAKRYNIRDQKKEIVNIDKYVSEFKKYITFKDNTPYMSKKGLDKVVENQGWIQILDENGREVYSYKKTKDTPSKYSPIEIVNFNRYDMGDSTIFVDYIEKENYKWTYIIGFPKSKIVKYTLYFNPTNVAEAIFGSKSFWILAIDIIAIAIIGNMFGIKLTRPLEKIIEGIKNLSKGYYDIVYEEKGVYKEVFTNLNTLSDNLRESQEERRQIEKFRQEWISNISHDIKTPLSSIKGYAEIIRDTEYHCTNEEIQSYVDIIFNKSLYLQNLVEDLNLTYKFKNNMIILDKQRVNIIGFIKESIIDILNDPKYSHINIELKYEKEPIHVDIDMNFFKRALNNLIYNAIIHNNKDVNIQVIVVDKVNKVSIKIKDDGKGIDQNDLKNVFKRYYRGTNTSEIHKGSGLGMAISKDIIEVHGGTIEIDSKKGEGTEVTIIINKI